MKINEAKLEFLGLLKANPDLEPRDHAQILKIPVRILARWKNEFNKTDTKASILDTIDTDEVIVDKIAEEVVKQKLELYPEEIVTDITTVQQDEIDKFKAKVTGLQALSEDVQNSASKILKLLLGKLEYLEGNHEMHTNKDLKDLTEILTSIQTAFFSKPGSINIDASNKIQNNTLLASFKGNLRR